MTKIAKVYFPNTEKSSLKDFNLEEARGWTIHNLQQIEYLMNSIIVEHFKPKDVHQFEKIVLNGSILDIGGKMKILRNIGVPKNIIEKIRKLSSIRNGFAHAPVIPHSVFYMRKSEEEPLPEDAGVTWSMIEIMNSQGVLESKNAYEYLVEFLKLYKEIREELFFYIDSLKAPK